jgi:UPF0042 nucleotide-binding protein
VQDTQFVILTGLSGAGKSLAMKCLEDLGFFCVDNLPPALVPKFAELCATANVNRLAMVIDVRGRSFFPELQEAMNQLPAMGFEPKILFLEASEGILVRRFSESRRRHPLAGNGGVLQAIQEEIRELSVLRKGADRIIDTSSLSPHQMMHLLADVFSDRRHERRLMVHILSFGFKNGLPPDADLVFDVRFVANPFYVPELRALTGFDAAVKNFVLDRPESREFLEKLFGLLEFLLPRYFEEGKQQLTLAIGCTGGQHRSTALGERIALELRRNGYPVTVQHRDVEQERARAAAV